MIWIVKESNSTPLRIEIPQMLLHFHPRNGFSIQMLLNRFSHQRLWWFARDLQSVLDYSSWDPFKRVILKAIAAYGNAGQVLENHFSQVGKMVKIGSGSLREIEYFQRFRCAWHLKFLTVNLASW